MSSREPQTESVETAFRRFLETCCDPKEISHGVMRSLRIAYYAGAEWCDRMSPQTRAKSERLRRDADKFFETYESGEGPPLAEDPKPWGKV